MRSAPPYGWRQTSASSSRLETTAPRSLGERQQQVELLAAQVEGRPSRVAVRAFGSTTRPPMTSSRSAATGAAPAQHGAEPGVELVGADGLDDVVVGAAVEGGHDVGVAVAGAHDDDRHGGDGPQHAQDLLPVDVGQAEVEEHDLGRLVDDGLQRVQARADGGDGVSAVGQRADQSGADGRVVLDDEDGGHEGKATPRRMIHGGIRLRRTSGSVLWARSGWPGPDGVRRDRGMDEGGWPSWLRAAARS